MSQTLPTKTSSRAGRFKKKLVDESALAEEALFIESQMGPVFQAFSENVLSAPELVAIYIISILSYRFPGTWLGSKKLGSGEHAMKFPIHELKSLGLNFEANIERRLAPFISLGDIFTNFALKSTPEAVNRSVLEWSLGRYGLELMFRIPAPQEVLTQQKQARRCVTVLLTAEKTKKFILGQRDALSFTMHDLIHADHFYHNNDCHEGQLGFYGLLDHCLNQKHFADLDQNEQFQQEFEYLIADMNAYAIHLLKCFKSAIIHHHPQKDSFFQSWVNKLKLENSEQVALLTLNSVNYEENLDEVLLKCLDRFKLAEL